MLTSRRKFFTGAAATLVAAPAIVRVAANLMPVSTKALPEMIEGVSVYAHNGIWYRVETRYYGLYSVGGMCNVFDTEAKPQDLIVMARGQFEDITRGA